MLDSTINSFLDGQGVPVDLPEIETELLKLWGPAAEQVGGPDVEHPNVTRIVLANLVVECLNGHCETLGPVLETVIAQYPCRTIVFRGSKEPGSRITAEVSALCHLPAPGLPQVCSERIVLHACPDAAALVPGAVRPLLEADLPMVLWWTTNPRKNEALFRDLANECSRLIVDLPDPGTELDAIKLALDPKVCAFSRDSAWFGLAHWRELIAQFFDCSIHVDSLKRISSVQVDVLSSDPTRPPRLAIWLVAWFAAQLGWRPTGLAQEAPTSPAASQFTATFEAAGRPVRVEISTRSHAAPARLVGVTITASGAEKVETFRVSRPSPDSRSVRVEAAAADACHLPSIVEAPELDPAHRIAAALESSRSDPPFEKARPIALWLLENLTGRS